MDEDANPRNDPMFENSSDIKAVISGYRKNGYGITHRDIKMQSLLTLISGTTYSLLRAYYDYFAHGDPVAKPAEFFGVRVPELNSYINARGLSFELESDYRIFHYLSAGIAYEFIWKGDFDQAFTPRARYNLAHHVPSLNEMWLSADLVIGKGLGGSIRSDYAPWNFEREDFLSHVGFFAAFTVYNAMTLYGERNIPSLTNQKTVAPEIIAGLYLRYFKGMCASMEV